MHFGTRGWSSEEDQLAIAHLQSGMSFGALVKLLPGRTRSGIISRANRKGWSYPNKKLPPGASQIRPNMPLSASPTPPPKTKPRPPVYTFPLPFSVDADERPRQELEVLTSVASFDRVRDSQCRYIIGEPRDRVCCGAYALEGKSWCERHAFIVFGVTPKVRAVVS